MFPEGLPGFALLVLRSCIAVTLAGSACPTGWQHAAFLGLVGLLVLGMFTPVVCGLASAVVVLAALGSPHVDGAGMVLVVLSTLSLACLGPGAFSADARLFGRRVLMSTSSSPLPEDEQR
jgi:hypothetical protein